MSSTGTGLPGGDDVEALIRPRPRVRSGCLTCRGRKVKCDEQRPRCYNCTRLRRTCIYAAASPSPRTSSHRWATEARPNDPTTVTIASPPAPDPFPGLSPSQFSLTELETWTAPLDLFGSGADTDLGTQDQLNAFGLLENTLDPMFSFSHAPLLNQAPLPPAPSTPLLLQDGTPFTYFLEHVDAPFIGSIDSVNWKAMKRYMVELGRHEPIVSQATTAVEMLYQAKAVSNDTMNAMSAYYLAKSSYSRMLEQYDNKPEIVLVVTFLLCCFEIVAQHETVPITLKPEGALVAKLEAWEHNTTYLWSPVLRRIRAWFQILHARTMHLGGPGLLSPKVGQLLTSGRQSQTPALAPIESEPPSTEEAILCDLSSALFEFYLEVQLVSTQITGLNRHHRSRGFQRDEKEVELVTKRIEGALHHLWQRRPALLRADRVDLQGSLPPGLKAPIGYLVDLCRTAYFAEIIYLGRAYGGRPTASAEALHAMREIRSVTDAHCRRQSAVDPGFIWPLFLYAVEHPDAEESQWAVAKLHNVQNPIWHSNFAHDLARGINEEQYRRGKRVDTRYFSLQHFSTPPPYM